MVHVLALILAVATAPAQAPLDGATIEKLTGAKGQLDAASGVFKVSVPRSDLHVTVAGVKLVPAQGLVSWAAFKRVGGHTMVMGDLTMTEDQVNAVMSAALDAGLQVTALHNHFFWDSPKLMFMHIGGMGETDALAGAVGKVFAQISATEGGKGVVPRAEIDASKSKIDPAKIDAILGHPGALSGGLYKVTFGRTTQMGGEDMGSAMGVNTWAAFAGTDARAVVDGDFAMLEPELQNVLKALRHGGLSIVAIHQHMSGETPRILFLHYWGVGPTTKLAKALQEGLAQTQLK
jgi:hypothetical protein